MLKTELCKEINLIDACGRLMKWTSIKTLLRKNQYEIKDVQRVIEGKKTKVSIITKM